MRPFVLTVFLSFIFHFCALSQYKISINKSCGFNKEDTTADGYSWDADDVVLEYVKKICDVSGISKNFTVQRSSITETACAVVDANNNRIIYYNQDFFSKLTNETYKIAILAHEIAHHLNNNLFTKDSKRAIDELDADKFAGSVICKLGLSLDDAKALYTTQCQSYSTGNYPARKDRIEAFSVGFHDAGCQNQKALNFNQNTADNQSSPPQNPAPTTGSIKVSNKVRTDLVILLGTEIVEPANFGKQYVQLTIPPNSTDTFDALAPGVYYICATLGRTDIRGCRYSKRVLVEAGKITTVSINSANSF